MKGIVFTELLNLVESKFSLAVADQMITESNSATRGAYTAVGTYDPAELVAMVGALSRITGLPVPELIRAFGRHLFTRFGTLYPRFFESVPSAFDFLAQVEGHIHGEVLKLYPEAQLPRLDVTRDQADRLVMVYRSERGFADLAHGLIEGCYDHFRDPADIQREDLSNGQGSAVRFTVTRKAA